MFRHINSPLFVRNNIVYIDCIVEIRIPKSIIEKLDKYQEENGLSTRTATILELLRKGLEK